MSELSQRYPNLNAKSETGGVLLTADFATGLALNLTLKTPTRILLRAGQFPCRDFPKLYQGILNHPWHEWIDPRCNVTVHAAAARSRVKIKTRIEKTCLEGWRAWQTKRRLTSPPPGRELSLYVRIVDNICSLSLDTSGERLHKRGTRKNIGVAPLRETIAAALLQILIESQPDAEAVELVDPMMGAGTFLLEAATYDQALTTRTFPFDCFQTQPATDLIAVPILRQKIGALTGYEIDGHAFAAAETNLEAVTQMPCTLIAADFFGAAHRAKTSPRWVIANPPYGERLKLKAAAEDYYAALFAAVEKKLEPDRACFLLPRQALRNKLKLPRTWKVMDKLAFSNGGIPVVAFLFART